MTPAERRRRIERVERGSSDDRATAVRMSWGNAQEATAVLTALNYFAARAPGVRVQEVGMCGAGLAVNATASSLLIGATPDALLSYPDGTVEVFEVKNHCPFVGARRGHGDPAGEHMITVREMPFSAPCLQPQYVPQMMMEMLCVGPHCSSAVMVRQTATAAALIIRLRRDERWLEKMMFWLERFHSEFVDRGIEPPCNFFWEDEAMGGRYQKFVAHTLQLASTVEVVEHVRHQDIQRMVGPLAITSLFLD